MVNSQLENQQCSDENDGPLPLMNGVRPAKMKGSHYYDQNQLYQCLNLQFRKANFYR
ncbi:hypothetical protein KB1253_23560 [Lactiplantibacillus plantarum]|nr:hypothetical protein KB1253_23560 [Lactiplantibacillus plantarum]GEL33391.1 hypothetical protein LPL02_11300 [Lactiplantibacillus plantarum subsp. plantarum]GIP76426.1 hypothetical protein ITOLOC_04210 [Lactiplantibacillus plantarum]